MNKRIQFIILQQLLLFQLINQIKTEHPMNYTEVMELSDYLAAKLCDETQRTVGLRRVLQLEDTRNNCEMDLGDEKMHNMELKSAMRQQAREFRNIIHNLERHKASSEKERIGIEKKLEEASNQLYYERENRTEAEREVYKLQNELAKLEEEEKDNLNRTMELQKLLETEKKMLKSLRRDVKALMEKITKLKEMKDNNCTSKITNLRLMLRSEKERSKEMKDDFDKERTNLKYELQHIKTRESDHFNQTTELQKMLRSEEGTVVQLREDVVILKNNLTELKKRNGNFSQTIKHLQRTLEVERTEYEELNKNLEIEMNFSTELREKYSNEINNLTVLVQKLELELIKAKERTTELQENLRKERNKSIHHQFNEGNVQESNLEDDSDMLKYSQQNLPFQGENVTKFLKGSELNTQIENQDCCKVKQRAELAEKYCIEEVRRCKHELGSGESMIKLLHLECTDEHGNTPLHKAAENCEPQNVEALVKHGASVTTMTQSKWGNTPIHKAAITGCVDALKYLVTNTETANLLNRIKVTPLVLAVKKGQTEAVRFLLEHGANVNVRFEDNMTSLHLAAFKGYIDIVKLLLEYKADPNAQSESLHTPLHIAAGVGHMGLVKLLVKYGADIMLKNSRGKTPCENAEESNHIEIARWLKSLETYSQQNKLTRRSHALVSRVDIR